MQQAYNQLRSRIGGLLGLHKAIKIWIDAQMSDKLLATIEYFGEVQHSLTSLRKSLAPDLRIVYMHARFVLETSNGNLWKIRWDKIKSSS